LAELLAEANATASGGPIRELQSIR
jgi:hypothetical protein